MDDSLAEWIRSQNQLMAELDPAADLDDLAPLAEIVGSARVVGLGESSHHVEEFYQVRHRMLRFLVERRGFTMLALEAPYTGGQVIDDWIHGAPGDIAEVARAGIALTLGEVPELHETLGWLRARNAGPQTAPVSYTGVDLPDSLGSPLPALDVVAGYIAAHDPASLPALDRARQYAAQFHDPNPMKVLFNYPTMPENTRDGLTAAIAEVNARMRRLTHHQQAHGFASEHSASMHHLRGASLIDQLHRSLAEQGIESASTYRDVYIAESVTRVLNQDPEAKIVLVAHNWHLRKAPDSFESGELFPAGYHLAAELGEDYKAIGVTSLGGHTGVASGDFTDPEGFPFQEGSLPPPEDTSIESLFDDTATWTLVDLPAQTAVSDGAVYTRMRMADYFCDQPALDCFDAMAAVTKTRGTLHTRPSNLSVVDLAGASVIATVSVAQGCPAEQGGE